MTDGAHKVICPHPVLIHPFCCDHCREIISSRTHVNLFSFFLLNDEMSDDKPVAESHVGIRMIHLM